MIPRTLFSDEHEIFRASVRKFLENECAPHHERWEEQGHIDREIWNKAGAQGFLCPSVPEAWGGAGTDFLYNCVIDEEIAGAGLSGIGWGLHNDIVAPYLVNYGSQYIKDTYLPRMATGELVSAIAMSEPGAGSDLQSVKTTAIRDGDHFVINGSKIFITNGWHSDLVIVVAKTDPAQGAKGTSLILVEAGTPGFSKGRKLKKVGMKAQDTAELFFDNVRVPVANLLGEEGMGFIYLMQELPQERLSVAVNAVAATESALRLTVDYVKERKAFGKPVSAFQNTQFKLAEMDSELTAMRVFIDRCIELHLQGKLDIPTAAKTKLLSTDLQCKVIDECVQLHGGYGYMWEYPIARAWADSRVQRIYAGTNEVMKVIISRSLLG
ncbi:MAG: acyl-CoA dehydrogenase family protein [Gammaproteobacteria bacterium]